MVRTRRRVSIHLSFTILCNIEIFPSLFFSNCVIFFKGIAFLCYYCLSLDFVFLIIVYPLSFILFNLLILNHFSLSILFFVYSFLSFSIYNTFYAQNIPKAFYTTFPLLKFPILLELSASRLPDTSPVYFMRSLSCTGFLLHSNA